MLNQRLFLFLLNFYSTRNESELDFTKNSTKFVLVTGNPTFQAHFTDALRRGFLIVVIPVYEHMYHHHDEANHHWNCNDHDKQEHYPEDYAGSIRHCVRKLFQKLMK